MDGGYSNLRLHQTPTADHRSQVPNDRVGLNDIADLFDISDNTANFAAMIASGALLLLVLLKWGGFRFAFGVNMGR